MSLAYKISKRSHGRLPTKVSIILSETTIYFKTIMSTDLETKINFKTNMSTDLSIKAGTSVMICKVQSTDTTYKSPKTPRK
jgi:hypothetical protein